MLDHLEKQNGAKFKNSGEVQEGCKLTANKTISKAYSTYTRGWRKPRVRAAIRNLWLYDQSYF